jgi:hypothetical protein
MKRAEVDQRKERLTALLREYRGLVSDSEKATREWAKAVSHEQSLYADSFLHALVNPDDKLGEARIEAAEASSKVARMEAQAKATEVLEATRLKRVELDKALDSFGRTANNDQEGGSDGGSTPALDEGQ